MSQSRDFKRRQIIQLLAGLGFTSTTLADHLVSGSIRSLLIDKSFFVEMKIDFDTLEHFVFLFLKSKPKTTEQSEMEHEIFGTDINWYDTEKMRDHILRKISDDFSNENTIKLDGWVLSKTEVQIWYIYFLLH